MQHRAPLSPSAAPPRWRQAVPLVVPVLAFSGLTGVLGVALALLAVPSLFDDLAPYAPVVGGVGLASTAGGGWWLWWRRR